MSALPRKSDLAPHWALDPDTVFMEEDCEEDGDSVILPAGLNRGSNRRNTGEDIEKGSVVVKAGRRLRAQEVGVVASVGRSEVAVYRPLKAAVFSTGDVRPVMAS